jgi:hypothetical protein
MQKLIESAKAGVALAPVTVVAPTRLAGLQLRRKVGEGVQNGPGFLNVSFRTLESVAELLGTPALAVQGKLPLSEIVQLKATELALRSSPELRKLAGHPASVRKIAELLTDLRDARNEEALSGPLKQVQEEYQRLTSGFHDDRDLYDAAVQAIEKGTPVLAELGPLLLCEPKPGISAPAMRLYENLKGTTIPEESFVPKAECWILPDAEQECRMAARKIAEICESGTPLHKVAVLFPSSELYGRLATETLTRAGIPCNSRQDKKQTETSAGRLLGGFLASVEGGYRRAQVAEWLCSVPMFHLDKPIVAHRWDRISKRARITKGLNDWRMRLGQLIGRANENVTDANREAKQAEIDTANAILGFLQDVERLAGEFEALRSWSDLRRWTKGLFKLWLPSRIRSSTEFELLTDSIDRLEDLGGLVPNPMPADFKLGLAPVLDQALQARTPFGHGVFVGTLEEAFGLRFEAAMILGMTSANLPRVASENLLSGPEARRLGLRTAERQVEDERAIFDRVRFSCENVFYSTPRADLRSMRETIPSHWFLEQVGALEGGGTIGFDKLEEAKSPKLRRIDSFEMALRQEPVGCRQEFQLLALASGHSAAADPVNVGRFIEAREMLRARRGDELSRWDGAVTLAEAPTFSATGLEVFAKCPFQFLLKYLVRLREEQDVGDPWNVDPLTRGTAAHDALKEFYRASIPVDRTHIWDEADHARFQGYLDAELEKLELEGYVQASPLWKFEKALLKESMRRYLIWDSANRRVTGEPLCFEFEFGKSEEGPLEFELEGLKLSLKGSIDRIDFDPATNMATVIDYKTGGDSKYAGHARSPLLHGRLYQLPLYGEVVKREWKAAGLAERPHVRGEYQLVEAVKKIDLNFGELEGQFRENVGTLKALSEGGLFPAVPGGLQNGKSKHCRYCDFDRVCMSKREDIWKLKRGDARLAGYVTMTEGEVEEPAHD